MNIIPNEFFLLLGKIDGKLDAIQNRLDSLAQRQDGHEARIGGLETVAAARAKIGDTVETHEKRIVELEHYKRIAHFVAGTVGAVITLIAVNLPKIIAFIL